MPSPSDIIRSALISPRGKYRYWLKRVWDTDKPVLVFVMLNPSTADAHDDDATIRRCIGFAKAWGYGGITVLNLFAARATNPGDMKDYINPIGKLNDLYIQSHSAGKDVVVAWGISMKWGDDGRDAAVIKLLKKVGATRIDCLGVNGDGTPIHPLFLPRDADRKHYSIRERNRHAGIRKRS